MATGPAESAQSSLRQAKQQAMMLIASQCHGEAQLIYERLLEIGLADAQVFANLAALYQIAGRSQESIPLLERAIALQPDYPEALLNLGNALQTTGRSAEAIRAFRHAINFNPALPEAHTGLGVALQAEGHLDEAIEHHRQALKLSPIYPAAWSNLGVALRSRGNCLQESIAAFREALQLKPDYAEALSNLGLALLMEGQDELALVNLRQAIKINPNHAHLQLYLADALLQLNCLPEAIATYHATLQLKTDEVKAYLGLARAHHLLANLDQALQIAEHGLLIQPDFLPLLWVKFQLQMFLNRPEEASQVVETMLSTKPDSGIGHLARACVLQETNRHQECHRSLDQALMHDPGLHGAYYCRSSLLAAAGKFQEAIEALHQAVTIAPSFIEGHIGRFFLEFFCYGDEGPRIRSEAEEFWRQFPAPQVESFPERAPLATRILASRAPIRLLILSGDIGNHSVSCFLEPLLRGIDRDRFQVVLALTHRRSEPRAEELQQLADELIDLTPLSEADAVRLLRNSCCAIALDTAGWTEHNPLRLLRHRVAPVQCHYVGFCGTTGLTSIDYLIGDAVLTPPELQGQFTEALWHLSRCWCTYSPTFTPPPLRDRLEGAPITFGSFNNLLKVGERCLEFWASAMHAVPSARLLLKDKSCDDPVVKERILHLLSQFGVDPQRITFAARLSEWHDHMELYNQVDIALDTTPMTSATTGFEALCMGVPLLAIQSNWMGGRMSSSALTALGRQDWISHEPASFAALANQLAVVCMSEPNRLKRQLHRQVRHSDLWNGSSLCRSLEQAFEQMLQRCATDESTNAGFVGLPSRKGTG